MSGRDDMHSGRGAPEGAEGAEGADAASSEPSAAPAERPAGGQTPPQDAQPGAPAALTGQGVPAAAVAVGQATPVDEGAPTGADLAGQAATGAADPAEQGVPVDAVVAEAAGGGLTWIPYAAYLGLWVGLAIASVWLLSGATAEEPARWMGEYEPLVWAGVGLAVLGPVLSLVVWLVARARRPRGARAGLFASAMTRGAVTAFFGALIWIGTLSALEIRASQGGW